MSLIVAIKDKDRIIVGSDGQVSTAGNKEHGICKIWEVKGLPGAIMGGVGHARASQILQYSDIIDKNHLDPEPTTEFVVCSLVPTIVATLKANGVVVEADEDEVCAIMPNSFIFAYKDQAWMIWNDLSVMEINDYFTIGSGSDVAKGVLFATRDGKNPFERIVTAIAAAAESTLYVDDDIDILCTENKKSDPKQIAKALGMDITELAALFGKKPEGKKEENKEEKDNKDGDDGNKSNG